MSYPTGEELVTFVFLSPLLSLLIFMSPLCTRYLSAYCPSLSIFYSLSLFKFFFPSILSFLHAFFICVFPFPLFSTYLFIFFIYNFLIHPCTGMFLCICSHFDQLTGPGAGHLHLHTNIEPVDVTVSCLICCRRWPLEIPGRKQNDWFLPFWQAHINP